MKIRAPEESDKNFIFNSWLKSYRNSQAAKHVNNPIYYTVQAALITKLLSLYPTLVACDPESPNVIWGWINADATTNSVNYIYVKHPFRRVGVAKALAAAANIDVTLPINATHLTHAIKKDNIVYNPYRELIE